MQKHSLSTLLLVLTSLATGYLLSERVAHAGPDETVISSYRYEYTIRCPAASEADRLQCAAAVGEDHTAFCPRWDDIEVPADVAKVNAPHYRRGEMNRCQIDLLNDMGQQGWEYLGQTGFTSENRSLPFIEQGSSSAIVFRRVIQVK